MPQRFKQRYCAPRVASELPGADKVTLPIGTYTMSIGESLEEAGATGDFDILDDLTINGLSTPATIVSGNSIDRVFDVQAGATASINGITVTNGSTGGISNTGTISRAKAEVCSQRSDAMPACLIAMASAAVAVAVAPEWPSAAVAVAPEWPSAAGVAAGPSAVGAAAPLAAPGWL